MGNQNTTRAVIMYLSGSTPKMVDDLKLSLSRLDEHFNDQFKYPVIIFHEDFDEARMRDICEATRSTLQFEKVEFEIPDFLNSTEIDKVRIGYRHMCRFMSSAIYLQPSLKDYDWAWRLDTDSFLLGKIDYDIFRFMQEHDYAYGYIFKLTDLPAVTKGLWDVVKKYIEENQIQPTFLHKFTPSGVWDRTYYYTNFEVSKLDFWRSKKYLHYFDCVDRSGGIYKYRWGDTIIRALAIFMFMPERQVHQFANIAYKHQGFTAQPL